VVTPDPLSPVLPAVPTTSRDFTRTSLVRAHLRAYQGGKLPPVPVTMKTTILDGAGTAVEERAEVLAAERFAPGRSTDLRVDVPVSRLAPGPHLLRIEAAAGAQVVRREVRFRIR
jgi:hypothetical protein